MATDFDEKAQSWDDDPSRIERARVSAAAIRAAVPLRSDLRLLEYGAGTGLVSQFLAGDVGSITLADASAGMRDVMAQKIAAGSLPAGTRIWDVDLARESAPADRFDLVVSVMTLHHIHDLDPVLRGFATLLQEGGDLCVVDLDEEDGSFHDDDSFEGHHGLSRNALAAQLHAAGFQDVRFQPCHEITKDDGQVYPLFLATCHITAP
jgi:SAM-dependent methyltransferase